MSYRLGVDVGGTFTDLLLVDEDTGRTWRAKTPSTPADQSEGVMSGLTKVCASAGIEPREIAQVLHGTTVATNALITRRLPRTAMICTSGFRDVIEIRRVWSFGDTLKLMEELP